MAAAESLAICYAKRGVNLAAKIRLAQYFGRGDEVKEDLSEYSKIISQCLKLPEYSHYSRMLRESIIPPEPTPNISMKPEVIILDGQEILLTFVNVQRLLRYSEHREEVWKRNLTQNPQNLAAMERLFQSRSPRESSLLSSPLAFLEEYAARLHSELPDIPPHDWMKAERVEIHPERGLEVIVSTLCATFDIVMPQSELFGLRGYTIHDTGKIVLLDIFARSNKTPEIPFTLPCGNVIIISASYGKIWGYDEITTIFHEFGHAFQYAFGTTQFSEHDYSEIPGVLFESFGGVVWESLGVPRLSGRAVAVSRQVAIGLFDIYVHRGEPSINAQKAAFSRWLRGGDYGHFWTNFEHFLSNYYGRYYSYPLAHACAEILFPSMLARPKDYLAMLGKIGVVPAARALREFEEKITKIIK